MRTLFAALVGAVLAIGIVGPAAAYIGPGAGLSLVGAFWGLVVAVLAALSFILLWPFRILLRRMRGQRAHSHPSVSQHESKPSDEASRA
ncbi:MAG: hypothetical protein ACREH6_02390 [Geminicoccaceae bacterium]